MKPQFLFIVIFLLLATAGCKKEDPIPVLEPKTIQLPAKGDDVVARSNEFGFDLFRLTALDEPQKNLMLSPLSASVALTMLVNGCAGNTYDQIHAMLGYDGLTIEEINDTYRTLTGELLSVDPEVQLALGNAVFYHETFSVKPPFLQAMNDTYEAHVEALDFRTQAALDIINQWASDNTMGKIPKVLDEISAEAVMFLMNALYFKGTWTWQFDEGQTTNRPFFCDDGSTVNVDMMAGVLPARLHAAPGYTALEMYYGRQNFSMVVLLPGNTVDEFLQDLNAASWQQITGALDAIQEPSEVDIMLPKFTFEYEKKLNDQLQGLGMTDAFSPGLADLSPISDMGIFVSFVKQNTFIKVDEEGTEAAAVTTIGIEYTSLPPQVSIDRPFLFAIRERTTNTLLFLGKVMDP